MSDVVIFGAKRTGTNYLFHLVVNNFDVNVITTCWWKHGVPNQNFMNEMKRDQNMTAPIMVKNPYAWLVSRFKFVNLSPHSENRDEWMEKCLVFAWIDELNAVYQAWLNLKASFPDRCRFIRYEDLLTEPQSTLLTVGRELGWKHSRNDFWNTDRVAGPCVEGEERLSDKAFDKNFHLEKRYVSALKPSLRDIVSKDVDWRIFSTFNYSSIEA